MNTDYYPEIAENLVEQADTLFDVYEDVSRVIAELEIPIGKLKDGYNRSSDPIFKFAPILRLLLYQKVGEYSQQTLANRVETWTYLQQRFELDRAPTQQAVSYTWRVRVDFKLKRLLESVAEGIRAVAAEKDIYPKELVFVPPEPNSTKAKPPIHHFVDDNVEDIIEFGREQVFDAFDTGRASNATYSDMRIWESQTKMSLSNRVGTRETFRMLNKKYESAPHNDTHLRAIKKLATPEEYQYTLDDFSNPDQSAIPKPDRVTQTVQEQFHKATACLLSAIRGTEGFREPVIASIDYTVVPFHSSPWKSPDEIEPDDEGIVVNLNTGRVKVPKEEYPEMVHGQKEAHTYGYEYATLSIVGRNTPIVIAIEPVRRNSTWEGDDGESYPNHEIVDRLMAQTTQHVDIHKVMADREFDPHRVLDVLDSWGVTYLIPKKKYEKDLGDIENVRNHPSADVAVLPDVPLHIDGEHSHDVSFMFVPSRKKKFSATDDGEYAVFLTNRPNVSADEAMGLTAQYRRRWDIENEYKVIKPFLPSIASTDYRMRCFTFFFSVILYNLWRMADHLVKVLVKEAYDDYEKADDEIRLKPLIGATDCISTFLDGFDPPD